MKRLLDGDTLVIELTDLDSLNADGKMIGIISHVEAMRRGFLCK
jgi:exonuclease SbcC